MAQQTSTDSFYKTKTKLKTHLDKPLMKSIQWHTQQNFGLCQNTTETPAKFARTRVSTDENVLNKKSFEIIQI